MIETIEANFQAGAQIVALGIEAAAILIIASGAIEAVATYLRHLLAARTTVLKGRDMWLRFAAWIVLSLEFALGADVIRTAIAPSWDDIGKLGAIATIRTALNYFLVRDIKEADEQSGGFAVKSDS
jgi:uncharacterized membrane protein